MYANGLHPKIQALYPAVDFPVSRGTPSIHSLPLWDYSEQWRPVCDSNYYNKVNMNKLDFINMFVCSKLTYLYQTYFYTNILL